MTRRRRAAPAAQTPPADPVADFEAELGGEQADTEIEVAEEQAADVTETEVTEEPVGDATVLEPVEEVETAVNDAEQQPPVVPAVSDVAPVFALNAIVYGKQQSAAPNDIFTPVSATERKELFDAGAVRELTEEELALVATLAEYDIG